MFPDDWPRRISVPGMSSHGDHLRALVDVQIGPRGSPLDWLWMTLMMLLWIVVIAGAVYAAVRLAHQHDHQQKPPLVR